MTQREDTALIAGQLAELTEVSARLQAAADALRASL